MLGVDECECTLRYLGKLTLPSNEAAHVSSYDYIGIGGILLMDLIYRLLHCLAQFSVLLLSNHSLSPSPSFLNIFRDTTDIFAHHAIRFLHCL